MRVGPVGNRLGGWSALPWRLIVDGDSNTANGGASGWYAQLQTLLAPFPNVTFGTNYAVSGNTWLDLQARQGTVNAEAGTSKILLTAAGTNDAGAVADGAALLARAQAYSSGVVGYAKHFQINIPPLTLSASNNPKVITYNTTMHTIPGISGVVSRMGIPELSDSTNSTYFESDGIHYKAPGWALIAKAVFYTLGAVLK